MPLVLLALLSCRSSAVPGPRPNVLLIVWETTRADHLSAYGYPLRTTPNLDALAREGVLFEQHSSAAPWTLPSVTSIFTGLDPSAHGVREFEDVLPAKAETLAERMQAQGYHTAALAVNSIFEANRGLEQGFDHYFGQGDVSGPQLLQELQSWLDTRPTDKPFFLYIHLFEPHCPYDPPDIYQGVFSPRPEATKSGRSFSREQWEKLFGCFQLPAPGRPGEPVLEIDPYLSAYDAELHYADHLTGLMLQSFASRGLLDESLVLMSGDHGEEFLEHGDHGHGRSLYQEAVHVPLIVRPNGGPGRRGELAGRRVPMPTSSLDVTVTVLAATGLKVDLHGVDLAPAWEGTDLPPEWTERPIFSGTDHEAHLRSVRRGRWKLLVEVGPPLEQPERAIRAPMLFDLQGDPGEKVDLADKHPATVAALSALLRAHEAEALKRGKEIGRERRDLDEKTEEALRRLGYLE